MACRPHNHPPLRRNARVPHCPTFRPPSCRLVPARPFSRPSVRPSTPFAPFARRCSRRRANGANGVDGRTDGKTGEQAPTDSLAGGKSGNEALGHSGGEAGGCEGGKPRRIIQAGVPHVRSATQGTSRRGERLTGILRQKAAAAAAADAAAKEKEKHTVAGVRMGIELATCD